MKIAQFLQASRWIAAALILTLTALTFADQNPPPNAPALNIPPAAIEPGALQPVHEKAAIIRLSGDVNNMMKRSLERRIDTARKAGCTLIIFEMDTYGGYVQSALEISHIVKRLPDENILTVAWVNDKAYSAGSMISVACQQIVMNSSGTIGDCAPILGNGASMAPEERAKATSPVLAEFQDSAKKNGYDPTLLSAMVVSTIEIHEVHNAATGETRFVDTPAKDKLLAEEIPAPGGAKERPWKFVQTVDSATQLLTITAPTALRMGISKATINDEAALRTALNVRGDLIRLDFSWGEVAANEIAEWLQQWWVRFMLFVAMMVLAVVEFTHPGASVPGICAVLCLALLVGAPFITGLAQAWEIVLILLGVAIIAADLYFFGGIGLLAIPGFILMALGLVASFIPMEPGRFFPTLPGTAGALWNGLAVVVFGSLSAIAVFALLSRYLYMTPGFNRLQLAPAGAAAPAPLIKDAADQPANEAVFVGAMGRATTDLRPAGKVRFDQHLVDVVSFGSFIAQGTEVEVISVEGYRIVVKPRPSRAAAPTSQTNTTTGETT